MSALRWAIAPLLALSAATASAGVTGVMHDCNRQSPGCQQRLEIRTAPVPDAPGDVSLFVGIMGLVDGQPHPGMSGWFDGRRWRAEGQPLAAWTGRMRAGRSQIPIPGGVCAMVREAGGPPGEYGVFVGWGAADRGRSGPDPDELRRMIRTAPPEQAQRLRELLNNYQEATARLADYDAGAMIAFSDMRRRGTFSQVRAFNCEGDTR